jgi:hypothetical protein
MNKLSIVFSIIFFISSSGCEKKSDNDPDISHFKVSSISDVDALAASLKNEILNSQTELSVTGTSYYVSNSGNDSNSGRSPSEAWATLSKVSETEYSNGDAVFFERGETWRGQLITKGGVRYSAYGEGSKPKIYGSPQNYSVKEKWLETEIPNVYVYDEALENDAGVLVFNEGEAHSVKKVIGIDGFSGTASELKNDLEMYHDLSAKRIYLYSDSGNPADRYSSIEFCLWGHIIRTKGNDIHIDNLCIKYGGAHGVAAGTIIGLKVTNCEFGWIGGSLHPGGEYATTRYGNAVQIWGGCKNYYVDHCYIYQVYDAGITHQWKNTTSTQPVIMENVTYSNNLIEYCIYSIEYFLNQANSENDLMKNILIKNNICRYAGLGWGWQRPNKVAMHIQGWRSRNPSENYIVTNNIFDRSRDRLIFIGAEKKASLPTMQNNIYIQNKGGKFGFFGMNHEKDEPIFGSDIKKLLIKEGIDENPTVIFVD